MPLTLTSIAKVTAQQTIFRKRLVYYAAEPWSSHSEACQNGRDGQEAFILAPADLSYPWTIYRRAQAECSPTEDGNYQVPCSEHSALLSPTEYGEYSMLSALLVYLLAQ